MRDLPAPFFAQEDDGDDDVPVTQFGALGTLNRTAPPLLDPHIPPLSPSQPQIALTRDVLRLLLVCREPSGC